MLLDLNLPDSRGIDTFRRSQTAAPHVPVILLMAPGADHDELAVRMLREGAQDFVIKKNADCASLAHAMRNAMERQRLVSSARAAAMTDPLTGLTNRSGFITLADRDRKLAERLGNRMMILLAKPMHLTEIAITFGDQRRDLTLVEAADHLRSVIGPTDIAARIAGDCFGLAIFETGVESLEEAWARMHSGAASHRVRVGAAIFDPDRPVSLDTLMERAASDLAPSVLAAQS
jgi:diguanylate cyclase (GGDEF)-like protein